MRHVHTNKRRHHLNLHQKPTAVRSSETTPTNHTAGFILHTWILSFCCVFFFFCSFCFLTQCRYLKNWTLQRSVVQCGHRGQVLIALLNPSVLPQDLTNPHESGPGLYPASGDSPGLNLCILSVFEHIPERHRTLKPGLETCFRTHPNYYSTIIVSLVSTGAVWVSSGQFQPKGCEFVLLWDT